MVKALTEEFCSDELTATQLRDSLDIELSGANSNTKIRLVEEAFAVYVSDCAIGKKMGSKWEYCRGILRKKVTAAKVAHEKENGPLSTSQRTAMPAPTAEEAAAQDRIDKMSFLDSDQVKDIAEKMAYAENPSVIDLSSLNICRLALIRSHLAAALEAWDTEREKKPPLMSREELRSKCKRRL